MKDLAEPVELTIIEPKSTKQMPAILTNLSAGGMDLVLLGSIDGKPSFRLNMHLPSFGHFEVEGKLAWSHPKESTALIGIQFTKIDLDHAQQINHMAEAYWECEDRIKEKAPTICFHGCSYWGLCSKPAKLKNANAYRTSAA